MEKWWNHDLDIAPSLLDFCVIFRGLIKSNYRKRFLTYFYQFSHAVNFCFVCLGASILDLIRFKPLSQYNGSEWNCTVLVWQWKRQHQKLLSSRLGFDSWTPHFVIWCYLLWANVQYEQQKRRWLSLWCCCLDYKLSISKVSSRLTSYLSVFLSVDLDHMVKWIFIKFNLNKSVWVVESPGWRAVGGLWIFSRGCLSMSVFSSEDSLWPAGPPKPSESERCCRSWCHLKSLSQLLIQLRFYHHSVFSLFANLFPIPAGQQQWLQRSFSKTIMGPELQKILPSCSNLIRVKWILVLHTMIIFHMAAFSLLVSPLLWSYLNLASGWIAWKFLSSENEF